MCEWCFYLCVRVFLSACMCVLYVGCRGVCVHLCLCLCRCVCLCMYTRACVCVCHVINFHNRGYFFLQMIDPTLNVYVIK